MGFQLTLANYLIFCAAVIMNSVVAASMGLFIGAAITNEESALLATNAIAAPFVIFSGIAVNLDDVYIWLRWVQYLSPLRYSMEILNRNEFDDKDLGYLSPVKQYRYNIGIVYCFVILAIMALAYRVLAILFLKQTAKR
jgi:ABC-type multidrug transport system permease subunit